MSYLSESGGSGLKAGSQIGRVGVGFPNPSGEVTSPLRWMPCLEFCCVDVFSPRGTTCPICLNQEAQD